MVDFFIEEAGVEKNNIQIINIIVDDSRFDGKLPLVHKLPYFAYCGTISTYKDGVDVLIKAFALFCKRYTGYQLRIAGKFYTPEDELIIKGLVTKYNLKDSVVFEGLVNASDMPSFLMGAKAVVLSRPDNIQGRNGFPTKLGEYLLSKSPVIVTSVGDIMLFIKNKEHGLIVRPNIIEDFSNSLCWVVENSQDAKLIGQRGFNLAQESFNYLTETKKLVKFMKLS